MLPPDISREQNITSVIYDPDSCLPFPIDSREYIQRALRPDTDEYSKEFQRKFRIFEASKYLQTFSSDRSHMKNNRIPPPYYPCIQANPHVTMNLNDFVDMNPSTGPGIVVDMLRFVSFASGDKSIKKNPLLPSYHRRYSNDVERKSSRHIPKYHSKKQHASFIERTRESVRTAERAKEVMENGTRAATTNRAPHSKYPSRRRASSERESLPPGSASTGLQSSAAPHHSVTRTRANCEAATKASKVLRQRKEEKQKSSWWDAHTGW